MSWADFYARKAVLDAVIERAHPNPGAELQLSEIPDAERLFGSADGVLLALQHRWNTLLAGRIDESADDGTDPETVWRRLAADEPTLRGVLDAGLRWSQRLRDARDVERWMLDTYSVSYSGPVRVGA